MNVLPLFNPLIYPQTALFNMLHSIVDLLAKTIVFQKYK